MSVRVITKDNQMYIHQCPHRGRHKHPHSLICVMCYVRCHSSRMHPMLSGLRKLLTGIDYMWVVLNTRQRPDDTDIKLYKAIALMINVYLIRPLQARLTATMHEDARDMIEICEVTAEMAQSHFTSHRPVTALDVVPDEELDVMLQIWSEGALLLDQQRRGVDPPDASIVVCKPVHIDKSYAYSSSSSDE